MFQSRKKEDRTKKTAKQAKIYTIRFFSNSVLNYTVNNLKIQL